VGLMARLGGAADRDVVSHGLAALRRLAHRGASPSLGAVDGCGVLTDIPWPLLAATADAPLPNGRVRALGTLFVHAGDRDAAIGLVERELRHAGALVGWRTVPTDGTVVLRGQQATTPRVLQVVAAFDSGRQATEDALYRTRLRIERAARQQQLRLGIASLSTTTVVYK